MIKKYSVLTGLIIALLMIIVTIANYPGGTYENKNAVGFSWTMNYFSNLFEIKALNTDETPSRIWAYFGIFFYSISGAIFFVNMPKKMPENIIKYIGLLKLPYTFLIFNPYT